MKKEKSKKKDDLDFSDRSADKPDFYTVIRRRKRTITDILDENNITNLEEFKHFKKHLEASFRLSQKFLDAVTVILRSRKAMAEVKRKKTEKKSSYSSENISSSTTQKKGTKKKKTPSK